MPTIDDDPFGGYDLPEEDESVRESKPPPPPARPEFLHGEVSPPAAWEPLDFRPRSGPGVKRCQDCMHYVRGGALAVDRIVQLRLSKGGDGFKLIEECKKFETEFEVRELEQIAEKAKTLDPEFDEPPRIHAYCIAGSISRVKPKIPEIKNHDGHCEDFFPGARPDADCGACSQRAEAYLNHPDFGANRLSEDWFAGALPDISDVAGAARSAGLWSGGKNSSSTGKDMIDSWRSLRKENERRIETDIEEYEQKLRDDVREAIRYGREPRNGTIDRCVAAMYAACAMANRSGHCPRFTSGAEHESLAGGKRWFALMGDERYGQAVDQVLAANKAALDRRDDAARGAVAAKTGKPIPPCLECAHLRYPAEIDPFAEIHFNRDEVMDLRSSFRREQKQRAAEELRMCMQPGPALGHHEVPTRFMWCAAHSERAADGKVKEYAYCYRVLKQISRRGECPSFSSFERTRDELRERECRRCRRNGDAVERDGRLWCVFCSDWLM